MIDIDTNSLAIKEELTDFLTSDNSNKVFNTSMSLYDGNTGKVFINTYNTYFTEKQLDSLIDKARFLNKVYNLGISIEIDRHNEKRQVISFRAIR